MLFKILPKYLGIRDRKSRVEPEVVELDHRDMKLFNNYIPVFW